MVCGPSEAPGTCWFIVHLTPFLYMDPDLGLGRAGGSNPDGTCCWAGAGNLFVTPRCRMLLRRRVCSDLRLGVAHVGWC